MGAIACRGLSSASPFRWNECAEMRLNWSIAWVEVMAKRDKRWQPSDDERLLKFSDADTPLPVIAITLGRTRSAVGRLATLKNRPVTPRRDQLVGEDE